MLPALAIDEITHVDLDRRGTRASGQRLEMEQRGGPHTTKPRGIRERYMLRSDTTRGNPNGIFQSLASFLRWRFGKGREERPIFAQGRLDICFLLTLSAAYGRYY